MPCRCRGSCKCPWRALNCFRGAQPPFAFQSCVCLLQTQAIEAYFVRHKANRTACISCVLQSMICWMLHDNGDCILQMMDSMRNQRWVRDLFGVTRTHKMDAECGSKKWNSLAAVGLPYMSLNCFCTGIFLVRMVLGGCGAWCWLSLTLLRLTSSVSYSNPKLAISWGMTDCDRKTAYEWSCCIPETP